MNNNFLGRYAGNDPNIEETNATKEIIYFSVTQVRLCNKSSKMLIDSSKEDRVFGTFNKFRNNDVSFTKGRSFRYPRQTFTVRSFPGDHNYGIKQTFGKACFHNSSCAPRKNSVQVLAKSTNSGHETDKLLTGKNNTKSTISGRIKMVERKFTSSKWQTSEDWNTKINNSNGCF